jgi:sigma-B regulation protein RsbU (phosphoserine phosphatase)
MEKRFNRFYALRQPEEVASMLNARLIADTGIEEYFTMAYCIVDLRSGVLKMVQAGHPHPLLLRKDGTAEFIGKGGVPVGLVPDIGYSQEEIVMEKGDRLLLYSDGFTEARLESGDMLEAEGLLELIRKCDSSQSGKEFLDDLYWNLTQILSPEHGLEDDVSATLFEYEGP